MEEKGGCPWSSLPEGSGETQLEGQRGGCLNTVAAYAWVVPHPQFHSSSPDSYPSSLLPWKRSSVRGTLEAKNSFKLSNEHPSFSWSYSETILSIQSWGKEREGVEFSEDVCLSEAITFFPARPCPKNHGSEGKQNTLSYPSPVSE